MPHLPPVHPLPDSIQVTPAFFKSFCTVAVNCCVPFTVTVCVSGETVTEIGGGGPTTAATLMVEVAPFEESATAVAIRVTVAAAASCGAV